MRILLILTIFLTVQVSAQKRINKFFTTKDGLPTNNIFKLRFDQKGFLWIAHDKGISRFDGFTFKNYSNPNQKSNVYTDIYIAPNGKIWMTNLGYQVYYIENDELKLYRSFELKYTPGILRIAFLSNGNMVFNANGGLIEVNTRTGEEHQCLINATITTFYQSGDDIYFISPLTNRLYTYKKQVLDSLDIYSEYPPVYKTNDYLIFSQNASKNLYYYALSKKQFFKEEQLQYNYNYSETYQDKFFVFSRGDVNAFHFSQDSISRQTLISGHNFTHYAIDNSGNEWYSTLNEGIVFVPSKNYDNLELENTKFTQLTTFQDLAYGMSSANQLYQFNKNNSERIADLNQNLNFEPCLIFKNLNDKKLLIGSSYFTLMNENHQFIRYFDKTPLKDACIDYKNNYYVSITGGIFQHPGSTSVLQTIAEKNQQTNSYFKLPISGRFNCITSDSVKKLLYFGGIPGFFVTQDNKIINEIKYKGSSIYSTVTAFCSPYVVVGTIQSGIFIIQEGRIIKHMHLGNSSIGNHILKIVNSQSSTWILSNKGLHRLNLPDLKLQSFTNYGSVDLNQCTDFTVTKEQIFIISNQSLYAIDLKDFIKSITSIPVYFNSINLGHKTIYNLTQLSFEHNENNLNINIDIPAASVLGNVEFEYRINENIWHKLNKGQTEIQLNQLNPGSYRLSIRQRGFKKEYSLEFSINKPIWNTFLFYFIVFILVSGVIFLFYLSRVRAIHIKSSSEIEKVKLEKALQQNILSSIKSQMNPHFLFNALNTIQSYIYLNDKKMAIEYLGKFSVLTRKILDQSNHEYITLSEEFETLNLYLQLEKMRFENTLKYSIEFENIPSKDQFRIPPMMIQPYVENAVKHGLMHKTNNRELKVSFIYQAEQNIIQINIEDNGIGRKRASEINKKRIHTHKPFSTEANKTRLEILNRDSANPIYIHILDKTDKHGNPSGTVVQINIPVL